MANEVFFVCALMFHWRCRRTFEILPLLYSACASNVTAFTNHLHTRHVVQERVPWQKCSRKIQFSHIDMTDDSLLNEKRWSQGEELILRFL